MKSPAPELSVVHAWLDSWSGLGAIVVGMRRHVYDLSLTAARLRITYLPTSRRHNRSAVVLPQEKIHPILRQFGSNRFLDSYADELVGSEYEFLNRLLFNRLRSNSGMRA